MFGGVTRHIVMWLTRRYNEIYDVFICINDLRE